MQAGWDYTVKRLVHRNTELLLHLASRPTLAGITPGCRAQLSAPWPDLVISAGRRNELVARWIKSRSPTTRIVHIGRPWSRPRRFDLVVSTPQYELTGYANVLSISLPLTGVDADRITAGRRDWEAAFAGLPAPRLVVLLGGASGAYVFDAAQARRLAAQVNALVATGGSLLVTSSRRTPERFVDVLHRHLAVKPAFSHRWHDPNDNPYYGLLAWGDRFVVTEDSVSMTAEALATDRSVALFRVDSIAPGSGPPWWLRVGSYGWKPLTHRLAMRLAPRRFHRDVRRAQQSLVARGWLSWLGMEQDPESGPGPAAKDGAAGRVAANRAEALAALRQEDLERCVNRTLALFKEP